MLQQLVNFAMIISSALMIWKGLIVYTESESPIVVVLRFGAGPAAASWPASAVDRKHARTHART